MFCLVSPQIITKPQNATVNETNALLLFCNATGRPVPDISWLKDGQAIPGLLKNQTMKIEGVTKKDAGVYTCSASSRAGRPASASAFVSVQCKWCVKKSRIMYLIGASVDKPTDTRSACRPIVRRYVGRVSVDMSIDIDVHRHID